MPNCGQNPIDHGALDHDDDDDKYGDDEVVLFFLKKIILFSAIDVMLTVAVRDLVTSVKSYLW